MTHKRSTLKEEPENNHHPNEISQGLLPSEEINRDRKGGSGKEIRGTKSAEVSLKKKHLQGMNQKARWVVSSEEKKEWGQARALAH